jgi:SAM-dependent methyltransferase
MSDWQERITHETAPAIRAEHELRYRISAPLILAGGPWVDLGCGNGLAAAAALGDARPAHAVLVDLDEQAVARAAGELGLPEASLLAGDLTDGQVLERIAGAVHELGDGAVVTCFEVVEHLSTFLPLLQWSVALAREHAATFVISVPNDAFWSIQNPHHLTAWSDGSFQELCGLLPAERTLMRQVALTGSALVEWDAAPARYEPAVDVGGEATIATHFIAAFGPRHREVWHGALAVQTDQLEQRRWERQRENDVALMQKLAGEHEAEVDALDRKIIEQREQLRENTAAFDEWRVYIHELERELGRPLSGSAEAMAAEAGAAPAAVDSPPAAPPAAEPAGPGEPQA